MSAGPIGAADACIALCALVAGAALIRTDVREHRLPDRLTGGCAAAVLLVALVASLARDDWSRWPPMAGTGLGMIAGGYLLAVLSPEALGLGDVKLLGVIGLTLGHLDPSTEVLWLLALAVTSAVWLVLASRLDHVDVREVPWRKRQIAFGPPMVVAWWLVYAVLLLA